MAKHVSALVAKRGAAEAVRAHSVTHVCGARKKIERFKSVRTAGMRARKRCETGDVMGLEPLVHKGFGGVSRVGTAHAPFNPSSALHLDACAEPKRVIHFNRTKVWEVTSYATQIIH